MIVLKIIASIYRTKRLAKRNTTPKGKTTPKGGNNALAEVKKDLENLEKVRRACLKDLREATGTTDADKKKKLVLEESPQKQAMLCITSKGAYFSCKTERRGVH